MGKKRKANVGILGRKQSTKRPTPIKEAPAKKPTGDQGGRGYKQEPTAKLFLSSRLHRQCSTIVGKLIDGMRTKRSKGSVKSLCLADHVQDKQAVYAVVCETLKHEKILSGMLNSSGLLESGALQVSNGAALVLLYEHLIGQGVKPRGKAERQFLAQADLFSRLKDQLLCDHPNSRSLSELVSSPAPISSRRFARVNSLLSGISKVKQLLINPCESWPSTLRKPLDAKDIVQDNVLEDVLSLPEGRLPHNHPLVESGQLVIQPSHFEASCAMQGKSSCMPAHVLDVEAGWTVLDCCAAPGNKTTHVASLVGLQGKVFACERDATRFKILQRTIRRCKATNVVPLHEDFLRLDPFSKELKHVDAILLDPSCSGSGTASSRMDHLLSSQVTRSTLCPSDEEMKRVEKLAVFQERALLHALSFPEVKRVVYSTCSVYERENEAVVANVLSQVTANGFQLVSALPKWHRRGLPQYPWGNLVVRVDPELDENMDGFFVALFERQL